MQKQVKQILEFIWLTRWDEYIQRIPDFNREARILFRMIIDFEVENNRSSKRYRTIHECLICFIQVLQIIDEVQLKWNLLFKRVPAPFELDNDQDDDKESGIMVMRYTSSILSYISEKNVMLYEKLQYIAVNDICELYSTIQSIVTRYENENKLKYVFLG